MKKPKVSVIVVIYNEEKNVGNCINSILNQSFDDFELILVDANSSDNTAEVIRGFSDKRIRCFRLDRWVNIPESRNYGIKNARGDYIFFTDADCTVSSNWISEGISVLERRGVIGCEGKTYYVSKSYSPSILDRTRFNKIEGLFPTCNIAYKKSVFQRAGLFDTSLCSFEDVDLGMRASNHGRIPFLETMVVFHNKRIVGIRSLFMDGRNAEYLTRLVIKHRVPDRCKRYGIPTRYMRSVAFPHILFITLFPFLLVPFFILSGKRISNISDVVAIPVFYLRTIFIRTIIWRTAIKNRCFCI